MIKPLLSLICLLFIISNFTALSGYGESPLSWNALPGNVKDEITLKLAKLFPPPEFIKVGSELEYEKELRKWKINYDKQREFLAMIWVERNQNGTANASAVAPDSKQNITINTKYQPNPTAIESNQLPVNSISANVGQVEPAGAAPVKTGFEVITVRLSKTAADLEMMKRMPLGRKTIGGQSDKPVSGEKPPACTMYAGKYGALYLGGGVSLSTVIFKSQNSGKYDRLIVDMNNDKDFSNDKVIEVPADGAGKELNIKVGAFDDTFIIRNIGGAASYFMLDYKYWMKGEAEYHGKNIQAVLTPNQDGRYSYGSQLFLDINENGKYDYSFSRPGQASSGKIQEMFPLAKYLSLDGKYYSTEINDSGTSVKLTKTSEADAKIDLKGKFLESLNDAILRFSSYTINNNGGLNRYIPLINISKKIGDLPISLPTEGYENSSFSIMKGASHLSFNYNKLVLEAGKTKTIVLEKPSFDINTSFQNDMLNVDLKWLPVNGIEYGSINPGVNSDKEPVKITVQTLEGVVLAEGQTGWG